MAKRPKQKIINKLPWYQHLWVKASFIGAGVLILGQYLDSISNAIQLIKPATTYFGTALFSLLLLLPYYFRYYPVRLLANNNLWYRAKGFGRSFNYLIIGCILLLWVPRAIDYICIYAPAYCPLEKPPPSMLFRLDVHIQYVDLGPLVYVHQSLYGEKLAPVPHAMMIEVVNNSPKSMKIISVSVDLEVNNTWVHLQNMSPINPLGFYYINNANLSTCSPLDFRGNSFDILSAKELAAGESLRGWLFLEDPKELRGQPFKSSQMRIQVKNNKGEEGTFIQLPPEKKADSLMSRAAGIEFLPGTKDLSSLGIMYLSDSYKTNRGIIAIPNQ